MNPKNTSRNHAANRSPVYEDAGDRRQSQHCYNLRLKLSGEHSPILDRLRSTGLIGTHSIIQPGVAPVHYAFALSLLNDETFEITFFAPTGEHFVKGHRACWILASEEAFPLR